MIDPKNYASTAAGVINAIWGFWFMIWPFLLGYPKVGPWWTRAILVILGALSIVVGWGLISKGQEECRLAASMSENGQRIRWFMANQAVREAQEAQDPPDA